MGEDLKEKIYEFLQESNGKRYNLTELTKATGISWATVCKWVAVLIAEQHRSPKVNIEDYGSIKIVWV